jgi:phosphoribosylanthranilate isomerase
MKIKICGLREKENIAQMAALGPDYLGFIFYEPSKRYAQPENLKTFIRNVPGPKRVGVFVNQTFENIVWISADLGLQTIQLHGSEEPELGQALKHKGFEVWKVFGMRPDFDWQELVPWLNASDAFLFDTSSPQHGGTGQAFDHSILNEYPFGHPFWLSGGLGPDFLSIPKSLENKPLQGLDVNSKFEISPGLKNEALLKDFIQFWATFSNDTASTF